jgi:hypothetical protein
MNTKIKMIKYAFIHAKFVAACGLTPSGASIDTTPGTAVPVLFKKSILFLFIY